ncbi:MAG: DUF1499 domain-containing protein [Anaerolineae bacterium]
MSWLKTLLWILLGLALLYGLARVAVILLSPSPENIGVNDNIQLAPCPDSPNCVLTQASPTDEEHYMEPLAYEGTAEEARQRLLSIIRDAPRTRIITAEPTYIYVEFRTLTMGFIDDVEFAIDTEEKVIHFRSASRLGYSDMGLNRRRMEEMIRAFEQRSR